MKNKIIVNGDKFLEEHPEFEDIIQVYADNNPNFCIFIKQDVDPFVIIAAASQLNQVIAKSYGLPYDKYLETLSTVANASNIKEKTGKIVSKEELLKMAKKNRNKFNSERNNERC